ncbi:hypothetical protein B0H16DRAFT_1451411 [Mycena metata]|uniref:Uncharacterized protein n=1 Tax=Mycena metata TaxID=1033252 RepID=A0AAD7JX52_9AGAR|nr:hypothetical protein B0H16DRAFT_1451411 [Mycena metata]
MFTVWCLTIHGARRANQCSLSQYCVRTTHRVLGSTPKRAMSGSGKMSFLDRPRLNELKEVLDLACHLSAPSPSESLSHGALTFSRGAQAPSASERKYRSDSSGFLFAEQVQGYQKFSLPRSTSYRSQVCTSAIVPNGCFHDVQGTREGDDVVEIDDGGLRRQRGRKLMINVPRRYSHRVNKDSKHSEAREMFADDEEKHQIPRCCIPEKTFRISLLKGFIPPKRYHFNRGMWDDLAGGPYWPIELLHHGSETGDRE